MVCEQLSPKYGGKGEQFWEETMRRILAAVALVLCSFSSTVADPAPGTRAEAIAMVKRVQEKFAKAGPQAPFDAITSSDEFRDRDLYPFVYDIDGWNVAHGANSQMVGKLWISTKDQDGNYLIKEMVAITHGPGNGWVDYKWPNPLTHRIQDKSAYIEKLGERYFVGVGIYKQ
jgi:cytochrome c